MRSLIVILVHFLMMKVAAQDSSDFRHLRTLKGDFTSFTVDNLGNIYAVTRGNQLRKYNPSGDSMGVFNDVRRYGKLTQIDASNPLKTILFYRDFKTVVVLDRLMNLVNTIDLRKHQLFQVKVVAQSYDNKIWLFDEQESRLLKLSGEGRLLGETAELRLVLDEAPSPSDIFDRNGFVYLYDAQAGLFVFDYYGALKSRVRIEGWSHVRVIGNAVYGKKEGRLMRYRTGTLQIDETLMPVFMQHADDMAVSSEGIYVLLPFGISLYGYDKAG